MIIRRTGTFWAWSRSPKDNGEKETQTFKFRSARPSCSGLPFILGGVLIGLMVLAYWKHSHPAKPVGAEPTG